MKTIVVVAWLSLLPSSSWANPSIASDFQSIMEWLTNETVQGLAFNAGSTFDPPDEIAPGRIQPDVSLGVGYLPLDKGKFPTIVVPALAKLDPARALPDHVTFPNLTLHMRMGLPNRWDFSWRGANMTVPQGYRLTPQTRSDGQSNSLGFGLRKHLWGGGRPLVSIAGNFNYVFGRFNFYNDYKDLELTPGVFVDSRNRGQLAWSVASIGLNAIVSQNFGVWTPFFGIGYNRMSGSVRGHLESDFNTPLIHNPVAEASDRPEEHQGRVIFGAQLDRSRLSYFLNGELKAIGASAGKTFIVSMGIAAPFHIGHIGGNSRHVDAQSLRRQRRIVYDLRDAPARPLPAAPRRRAARPSRERALRAYPDVLEGDDSIGMGRLGPGGDPTEAELVY